MAGNKIEKPQNVSPFEELKTLRQQVESEKVVLPNSDHEATHAEGVGHLDALIEGIGSHERSHEEQEALTRLGEAFPQNYDLAFLETLANQWGWSDVLQRVEIANAHPATADLAVRALLLASKKEFRDPEGLEGLSKKPGPWQEAAIAALALRQGKDPVEVLGN